MNCMKNKSNRVGESCYIIINIENIVISTWLDFWDNWVREKQKSIKTNLIIIYIMLTIDKNNKMFKYRMKR